MKKAVIILILFFALFPFCATQCEEYYNYYNKDTGEHYKFSVTDNNATLLGYWVDEKQQSNISIVLPDELDGVPLTAIGWHAFDDLAWNYGSREREEGEISIVIPEGVVRLDQGAFGCIHCQVNIYLPSTLCDIKCQDCFFHCRANLFFPTNNPFYTNRNGFLIDNRTNTLLYCAPSSKAFPLPDHIQRIGDFALCNYCEDKKVLIIPDKTEYIGEFVIYDNVTLKKVIIPGTVKEIADYAFYNNLTEEFVICEGVQKIGARAFDFTRCESITIPFSVKWLGFIGDYEINPKPGELWSVIVLNPDCYIETEKEYRNRT